MLPHSGALPLIATNHDVVAWFFRGRNSWNRGILVMYEDNLATKPLLPCNLLSALSPTPFFFICHLGWWLGIHLAATVSYSPSLFQVTLLADSRWASKEWKDLVVGQGTSKTSRECSDDGCGHSVLQQDQGQDLPPGFPTPGMGPELPNPILERHKFPPRKTGGPTGGCNWKTILILQSIMTLLCSFSGISRTETYNSANRQDWPSLSWPTLLVKASQSVLLPGRMET